MEEFAQFSPEELDIIEETLIKEVPKEIDLDTGKCPVCEHDMYKCNYKDNYCPNCGNKINWEVK